MSLEDALVHSHDGFVLREFVTNSDLGSPTHGRRDPSILLLMNESNIHTVKTVECAFRLYPNSPERTSGQPLPLTPIIIDLTGPDVDEV